MKTAELLALQPGAPLTHRRYGACTLLDTHRGLGFEIEISTPSGAALLRTDAGVDAAFPARLMEAHPRNLSPRSVQ